MIEAERSAGGVRHWLVRHGWLLLLVAGESLLAEWIRLPRAAIAVGAVLCWGLGALPLVRRGGAGTLLAGILLAKALLLGWSHVRIDRIERDWPGVREQLVTDAADQWLRDLRSSRALVERVATSAVGLDRQGREIVFDRLGRQVAREGLEVGVAVLDADGTPYAWAGRHRLAPDAAGDSIDFRASPYYAVLEARRHLGQGRTAIATLLLAADSTVPDQARSLARRFERRTGVAVDVLPRGVAPDSSDVFDYLEPSADGSSRLLFSVRLEPPTQSAAHERAYRAAVLRLVVLGVAALVLTLGLAPAGGLRFVIAAVPVWVSVRAPLGDALSLPALFSPRTFNHPLLGPVSETAGPLMLAAAFLVMVAAAALRRRRGAGRWGIPFALVLLFAAPYLVSQLGRGIQVPPGGAPAGLWFTWQATVFLVAASIVLVAAALVPNSSNRIWPAAAGATGAVGVAVVGLVVWNARSGWPDWYPFLWAAAIGLVIWPGRRAARLAGIGVAVGAAAALMVWGAEVEGRITAARADLSSLGIRADPIAIPLLEAFAERVGAGAPPRSASELFAVWRSSPLSRQAFPAALGLWSAEGDSRAQLRLDEVDLPDSLVARAVRELRPDLARAILPFQRNPAVHYLALIRVDASTVLSVGLGPRTSLVRQARLGRLLDPEPSIAPLYLLTLAPTGSLDQPDPDVPLWSREGWTARGRRTVAMGDGARDVNGVVDLGLPQSLLVRGSLLVVLDLLLLFTLAGLASWLATARVERPLWWPEWRAFRTRITMALGGFFLVPAAAFALINIVELANEGRSRRDLMIAQTLRDASPGATLPVGSGFELDRALETLSERVDANLVLFKDGRLIGSNGGGVFEDFGVVDPLVDPAVFHQVELEGEPTAMTDGPSSSLPARLGVRSVRLPTGDGAMLGSPQAVSDPGIGAQQRDLAYGLALAVVMGLVAAVVAARVSARALSRPAADLRDAALAFGRGEPLPSQAGAAPTEFEPVFQALEKMAADVQATRAAEERAARVLAWGEMANQIAHEIKNPLTPMRLGVQHLLRVYRDGRPIGATLEETSKRILGEIDRLDTIARAFSRFAAPAEGRPAPEPTPLAEVCREVVALYGIAPGAAPVRLEVLRDPVVLAQRDEVKEALINLLENARNAEAKGITVRVDGPRLSVQDDGVGIPADRLPRIFEPRFSTTTSGSGLGLAIVKRLVEGWGAGIEVVSEPKIGTTVTIGFREP